MKPEPIKIRKRRCVCKNKAAVELVLALNQVKLFDENGREVHVTPVRGAIMVWYGSEIPKELYATLRQPIPDREAIEGVEQRHPDKSKAEKLLIAQTDTLLRLAKAENVEEACRMQAAGLLDSLIEDHNSRMRPKSKARRQ